LPSLWPPLSGQSLRSPNRNLPAKCASEPLSPHEIMVKQGKALPAEFWDAF
jgi:hypothetical protein